MSAKIADYKFTDYDNWTAAKNKFVFRYYADSFLYFVIVWVISLSKSILPCFRMA